MLIAADYPFMDVFWSILIFFLWFAWLLLLFRIFADIFRRHDISGWAKAAWCLFVIVLPFLGVLIYLIAEGQDMGRRDMEQSAGDVAWRPLLQAGGVAAGAGGAGAAAAVAAADVVAARVRPRRARRAG